MEALGMALRDPFGLPLLGTAILVGRSNNLCLTEAGLLIEEPAEEMNRRLARGESRPLGECPEMNLGTWKPNSQ